MAAHLAEATGRGRSHSAHSCFFLCRLWPPISLPKRDIAVAYEPLKGDRPIFKDSAVCGLASPLGDLGLERIARPELRHLPFAAEPNAYANGSDIFGFCVDHILAVFVQSSIDMLRY